jgi:hypothetical protein
MEAARALGSMTLKEGGRTDAERLTYAFRRCVSRAPSPGEKDEMLGLLARQMARFQGSTDPWAVAAEDPAKPPALPPGVTPAQAASWTIVSRVLLNLDEAITKE